MTIDFLKQDAARTNLLRHISENTLTMKIFSNLQAMKGFFLALAMSAQLSSAGEMDPKKLISSMKAGDRIVLLNKPNKNQKDVTPETKALSFTPVGMETGGTLVMSYLNGKKYEGEDLRTYSNFWEFREKYNICNILLETKWFTDLTKVELLKSSQDMQLDLVLKEAPIFDLALKLRSARNDGESIFDDERSTIVIEIVPLKTKYGSISLIQFEIVKPVHVVKTKYAVSDLMNIFGEHAKFYDRESPQPK